MLLFDDKGITVAQKGSKVISVYLMASISPLTPPGLGEVIHKGLDYTVMNS